MFDGRWSNKSNILNFPHVRNDHDLIPITTSIGRCISQFFSPLETTPVRNHIRRPWSLHVQNPQVLCAMPLTSKTPARNSLRLKSSKSRVSQTTYPQPRLGVGWRPSAPFFGTLVGPLTLLLGRRRGRTLLSGLLSSKGWKSEGGSVLRDRLSCREFRFIVSSVILMWVVQFDMYFYYVEYVFADCVALCLIRGTNLRRNHLCGVIKRNLSFPLCHERSKVQLSKLFRNANCRKFTYRTWKYYIVESYKIRFSFRFLIKFALFSLGRFENRKFVNTLHID